jgi:hypothetical protein
LFGGGSHAQELPKAILHVTGVRSGEANDWCTTGKCSATKLTVEGYINASNGIRSVEYVLECVEVMAQDPTPHYTIVCDHVHANRDYVVNILPNAIGFVSETEAQKVGQVTPSNVSPRTYDIKSEKEVAKPKAK